jgi:hypothetical protein
MLISYGRDQGPEICADNAERNRVPVKDPSGSIQESESEENCSVHSTFGRFTAGIPG